jgi:hypothetical protein
MPSTGAWLTEVSEGSSHGLLKRLGVNLPATIRRASSGSRATTKHQRADGGTLCQTG